jgi:hypothetical protein
VLVNGSPNGFFNISRRLRQGDPLSPLLFVFVMEALSRMISTAVNGGLLEGFKVGNATFSHLLFADDTLIFCNARPSQLRYLRSQSASIPVGDVDQMVSLADILGCGVAILPEKHLDLPLGAS